ncbi:cupin domain-containing protein [Synechococcus sp. PCC 6312]|uniref:cupin domain-containing protein n=1 Tax=Synechococcus sp. (strain ATCC 27167 / PCC 6312) TaxID=195253 RepID=UPI00029ED3D4|nr:cupin domain-containing protein [Synechococcus sp. PCC 6312]AFY60896.1 cupin domain-containing protein [Synechococcus sp. PCC 6312]
MTTKQPQAKTGENFAMADFGGFQQLRQYVFEPAEVPVSVEGKIFLKQVLDLTSAEISLNNLPPNKSIPFYHTHRVNEEIYIFVQGEGEFQVDQVMFGVREGTIIRVDPAGERCIRNISDTQDLCYIVIQSQHNSYLFHTIQDGTALKKRVSWVGKQRI